MAINSKTAMKKYRVGEIYRPKQDVTPIVNQRRSWGIITAVEECEDSVLIEFDCGIEQGDESNVFTEIIIKENNLQMTQTNPIQFLDFKNYSKRSLASNPNECVIYRRTSKSKTFQLRFPKNCESIIESGFNRLRVAINNLTDEVFFVLSKEDGLCILEGGSKTYRTTNRELVLWLEDRFNLPKDGGGVLTFSENLDRQGGYTYRVMPKPNN